MDLYKLITEKAREISEIAENHGAENLKLFGSVARKDFKINSDVDFLYSRGNKKRSPWFPAGLIIDLENLLGTKVDLVNEKFLSERMKTNVLKDSIPLCELILTD